MRLTRVDSTNVEGVGYEGSARALVVRFRNGGAYEYAGVEPDHASALMASPSPGRFLREVIRSRYQARRLSTREALALTYQDGDADGDH